MIGLDTNVIIRFLTRDDEEQFQKAYKLLTREDASLMISYPTLVELIWVLETHYKYGKKNWFLYSKNLKRLKTFISLIAAVLKKQLKIIKATKPILPTASLGF